MGRDRRLSREDKEERRAARRSRDELIEQPSSIKSEVRHTGNPFLPEEVSIINSSWSRFTMGRRPSKEHQTHTSRMLLAAFQASGAPDPHESIVPTGAAAASLSSVALRANRRPSREADEHIQRNSYEPSHVSVMNSDHSRFTIKVGR